MIKVLVITGNTDFLENQKVTSKSPITAPLLPSKLNFPIIELAVEAVISTEPVWFAPAGTKSLPPLM